MQIYTHPTQTGDHPLLSCRLWPPFGLRVSRATRQAVLRRHDPVRKAEAQRAAAGRGAQSIASTLPPPEEELDEDSDFGSDEDDGPGAWGPPAASPGEHWASGG